jgi:hypothetical protein
VPRDSEAMENEGWSRSPWMLVAGVDTVMAYPSMGEVESEVVADESDMMSVGGVASRWREFGLRRTFSSVPENDHLSELLPFCLSERESIDGWGTMILAKTGGGHHVHSWNKSTSRLRARQSPEKQLTR